MHVGSRRPASPQLVVPIESPPLAPELRTAVFVYARTTITLACPEPVRLSTFLGGLPDAYLDAGLHALDVEPGVYLAQAGPPVDVTGDPIDAVPIVDGRPARRTPRRLSRVLPSINRRALARFLRRPAAAPPRPLRAIRRILAIDEDPAALARYARGFGPGRTVLAATDPAAARELAARAPCELAIVELRIQRESGLALARELKRAQPELVVALCSAYLSVESAVAAVRAGLDAVLFKPVTAREILRRLGAATDGTEPEPETLEDAEREHIARVLADCRGNITIAARRLGIYRSSLQRRLRRLRLSGAAPQRWTCGSDGRRAGGGIAATASGSAGAASPEASSSSNPASRIIW